MHSPALSLFGDVVLPRRNRSMNVVGAEDSRKLGSSDGAFTLGVVQGRLANTGLLALALGEVSTVINDMSVLAIKVPVNAVESKLSNGGLGRGGLRDLGHATGDEQSRLVVGPNNVASSRWQQFESSWVACRCRLTAGRPYG
jgi:hypothetical protein